MTEIQDVSMFIGRGGSAPRITLKKNQNISIDEKHTLLMNEFHKIENETIPHLQMEKKKFKHKLKKLKSIVQSTTALHSVDKSNLDNYMNICDKIQKIDTEIKKIKNKKKKYLLENSAFIFNYFEEKKNIAGAPATGVLSTEDGAVVAAAAPVAKKSHLVHSFFKIKKRDTGDGTEIPTTTIQNYNVSLLSSLKQETNSVDKYRNSRKYWANVNNQIVNVQDYVMPIDICQKCKTGELISQEDEGVLICNQCGVFVQHIIDCEKPSYKEPPSEVSYTAYVRLNHFKEILSQFQAKETTQIPEDVIEAIRSRIKKERITDISEITYTKTRDILRKLGYNKYFEHIQYINCKFGIKPPTMTEELVETLCVLFIEIQAPWAIHCPSTRTNFFNYAYTLYQLCKLLDQTQFLPFIPMMKDAEKGKEQDTIWRKVCDELDWFFYPSV
jgi:hypothetical protein